MLCRRFSDDQFAPWLAIVLLTLAFYGFSFYLFFKTSYAPHFYVFMAWSLISGLGGKERNDFLRLIYSPELYIKLRLIENLICVSPFVLYLLWKMMFFPILIMILGAIMLSFVRWSLESTYVIPSPFSKKPFEFTIGFRRSYFLYFGIFILAIIAASVGNFNLGIFCLLAVFAIAMSHYGFSEPFYYVWIYSFDARQFLLHKIKTALLHSSTLALPVIILLTVLFPSKIGILLLSLVIGWAFLIFMIVSKYATYPKEPSILQGILLALCISFPPLLLILIPYTYHKSVNHLRPILS